MSGHDFITPQRMGTERSLPWKSSQVLARILTTLLFDLKVHGRDAFDFYTDKKVTISRWF